MYNNAFSDGSSIETEFDADGNRIKKRKSTTVKSRARVGSKNADVNMKPSTGNNAAGAGGGKGGKKMKKDGNGATGDKSCSEDDSKFGANGEELTSADGKGKRTKRLTKDTGS